MTDSDRLQMVSIALMRHNVYTKAAYEPKIWNDEGIYTYFYIDFRRALTPFSLGMLSESIIVYDSVALPVTAVTKISDTVYKLTCDISNKMHGITVINKKTSRLRFLNGERVPAFSVHMYIAGQDHYDSTTYLFDSVSFGMPFENTNELQEVQLWSSFIVPPIIESVSLPDYSLDITDATESVSFIFT